MFKLYCRCIGLRHPFQTADILVFLCHSSCLDCSDTPKVQQLVSSKVTEEMENSTLLFYTNPIQDLLCLRRRQKKPLLSFHDWTLK